jgi:hypothetical protein
MQRILALLAGFVVAAAIGGWGRELPVGAEDPAAAHAVRALAAGSPAAAGLIPADFAAVMGYRPQTPGSKGAAGAVGAVGAVGAAGVAGGPARPDGGCSSPFGGTPYRFTPACRQHDLGYDLLRYADAKGRPLGAWARRAVDGRFAEQTRARCHGPGCRLASAVYTGTVRFNSWRQGYGTPVAEPPARLAGPAVAGIAAAGLLGLGSGRRPRRDPIAPRRPGAPVAAGSPA